MNVVVPGETGQKILESANIDPELKTRIKIAGFSLGTIALVIAGAYVVRSFR